MNNASINKTNEILFQVKDDIINTWIKTIHKKSLVINKSFTDSEIASLCSKIIHTFLVQIELEGDLYSSAPELSDAKKNLDDYSALAVAKGMSQIEVGNFLFSLKNIVFDQLSNINYADHLSLSKETVRISEILDRMSLYTFDMYVREHEKKLKSQQQDIGELSSPIIQVWEKVLAISLIGTLDRKRTQIIMEKLLEKIACTSSKVAIIDITKVPAVDTFVANQLLKTASATKLLGAELIITGISPVVAQTMVHLGVDLSGITTRAVMSDGLKLAMEMAGFKAFRLLK